VPALAVNRRNCNKIKINNQPAATATPPISQPAEASGDDNITEHWQWHCGSAWPHNEQWYRFIKSVQT